MKLARAKKLILVVLSVYSMVNTYTQTKASLLIKDMAIKNKIIKNGHLILL